jgi:hypothetical protein
VRDFRHNPTAIVQLVGFHPRRLVGGRREEDGGGGGRGRRRGEEGVW